MEGVRWTNEDDDEDESLDSYEISRAPEEEAEEEPSWIEAKESRAEDFLSIIRGEKGEDEEESESGSLMGKLIGERPAEIEDEDTASETEVTPVSEEIPSAESPDEIAENSLEQPADSPDIAETPVNETQEVEDLSTTEEDPVTDEIEEPIVEDEQQINPQEVERDVEIEDEPIVEEEPQESEPEIYESGIDELKEAEEPAAMTSFEKPEENSDEPESTDEELPAEEPLSEEESTDEAPDPIENEEQPRIEEEPEIAAEDLGDGDDGGEQPPEEPDQAVPNPGLPNRENTHNSPENVHVTHEHESAGAGIVGVLLGMEFFARRRADKKLKRQMEKNRKIAEEADETAKEKMLRLEEEQRRHLEEQERLKKVQNELKPAEAKLEDSKDKQESTSEEVQSVAGETFSEEEGEKDEEAIERKAGLKLETSLEDSPEEARFASQEASGEQSFDSRQETATQKDDGSGIESTSDGISGPTHISDVISNNDFMRSREQINSDAPLGSSDLPENHPSKHDTYMSSVQAGVAIGLIIIVIAAIIFFVR